MSHKILFVDDEQNILDTISTMLRKRQDVFVAHGPEEALRMVAEEGPFAVVVSDFKMPGMNGVQLLTRISEISPNTVRVMLTGYADIDSATSAINEGRVFRFLTKPCSTSNLVSCLEAALEQHRLIISEKELLHGTLQGCIKVLTEILGQLNPEAFGRSDRIKRHVKNVVQRLGLKNPWKFELAAMLSQIGCIFIPEDIVHKSRCSAEELSSEELQIFQMHPTVGYQLLSSIPRLEDVREMMLHQEDTLLTSPDMSRGARILKVCLDFDNLESCLGNKLDAIGRMKQRTGVYDSHILDVFERYILADTGVVPRDIRLVELKEGMILGEDLMSEAGELLLAKGLEVNSFSLMRLQNLAKAQGVRQPFRVLLPMTEADGAADH
ncbi:MAG: response regulator [Desulfovibrio sp.]|nr:response regulator [Desulfovibrio sp.]MBI4961293.1 response regulator [Desulfovibrio sp.]